MSEIKKTSNYANYFKSMRHDYETPKEFYQELNDEFHFDLDPCTTTNNLNCRYYFTEEEDGLKQDWKQRTAFVNPPYGDQLKKWAKKCYEEWGKGSTIVLLIPARTQTNWFHNYIYGKAEIRFIKTGIQFVNTKGKTKFPFLLAIFKPKEDKSDF
jgi:phage N-6-adenine-methyltransferase